jgi:hypothetical protein
MIHILLYAIVPIIVVMLVGYVAGKKGIFNANDAKAFNKIVLDYALPAALFVSITGASREMLIRDIKLSLIAAVGVMACFLLVYFIYAYAFKGNSRADGAVMALICGSPTIGFLGFAVLEPIFGTHPSVALVVAIVGIVVNAIGIPTGLSLLNAALEKAAPGQEHPSTLQSVVHALRQPVAWAPILAVVWVALGIPWPTWASPSFDLIKGANASMAVFAAGITLSSIKVDINWQAVLGCILKLIVMPAVVLVLGLIFKMEPMNLKMLVIACSLPPAFSGIIIASQYDTYEAVGTSTLALNIVLFIAFCPLWIYITDLVVK